MLRILSVLLFFAFNVQAVETLKVLRKIPHSGYSEGLDFHQGYLWHALPKEILKIDPINGNVVKRFKPATEYSESLVWINEELWNVSFSDNGIYSGTAVNDVFKFKKRGTVPEKHAWGIIHTGKQLVVTGNYSHMLYFLNPETFKVDRKVQVSIKDLEDLAWDGERIWASSFTQHKGEVFSINPKNGKIDGFYKLPNVNECPVIDGIAYDGKNLWITGKHCTSIYYVKKPVLRVLSTED